LPITEIVTQNEFFDFQAKYEGASEEITPAKITDAMATKICMEAKKAYQVFNCNGVVRIDFIFNDKSNIYIFEDNTNITKYKFLYLVNYDNWTLYKDNSMICNNKIFDDMVLIYLNIFKNISNLSIVPYPNPYIKTKVIKFTNKFNKCNKNNILKKKNLLNNTNDDIDFINDSLNKLSFNNENNDIDVINNNLNKLSFNNNENNDIDVINDNNNECNYD
jgi:hypothetical protein